MTCDSCARCLKNGNDMALKIPDQEPGGRIWRSVRGGLLQVALWFDSSLAPVPAEGAGRIDWLRVLPFVGIHAGCLAAFATGVSVTALGVAAALYALRMFAITGFYHRYFSHRAFSASRAAQFAFALLAASSAQRGPLWWASHHRHHHVHSDGPGDPHSARRHGFWRSHLGWFLARGSFATRMERVPDLAAFPELRFLDRFDVLAPVLLGVLLFCAGELLAAVAPQLGTNGPQLLVWGFFVSTVALYHATFCINSLSHRFGSRRYDTGDDSRNNLWLALITLGEGWHNNHHHFPGAARQGFYWWELDVTHWGLRLLAMAGLVWDLKPVPDRVRASRGIRVAPGAGG